jgi:pantothenate kinase
VISADLAARAASLARPNRRAVLGLAGAPGAGKSTLAAELVAAIPGAVLVPMDGFHLPTATLAERGWVDERGTPRTFDADGYAALLWELRTSPATVWAPDFDRGREEPVPHAIEVPPRALVVTEGNYLLLWPAVRPLLDEVWFVEVPEELRVARLVARHVAYGRSAEQARHRVLHGPDAANARLVTTTRERADMIVTG